METFLRHGEGVGTAEHPGPGDTAARGEADVAAVARLVGEPARATMLSALAGGRSRSASGLATEAGLSPAATSAHLTKLTQSGLITVEQVGRHRYYSLAGPAVAELVEALARVAPARPVTSLRQSTRAQALRAGRTCYDHLAGGLGVALTRGLVDQQALVPLDQQPHTHRRDDEPPVGRLQTSPYRLGPNATKVLARLGLDLDQLLGATTRRPLLRFCVDWSEQRHHLAGRLGAALSTTLIETGWITHHPHHRAVTLTDRGTDGLQSALGCLP